jgi:imidazole glycerol-phosphate synthase subunit HisH
MPMIAVIDYGMGNLRSVQKAFEYLGFDARIINNKEGLTKASHIVLPGVGAFADAAAALDSSGLKDSMIAEIKKGKPFLGICLGMQLLFEKSYENGEYEGLSLIPGKVVRFDIKGLKVPHMGWNNIITRDCDLFSAGMDKYVYFVHSYHASEVPVDYITAEADYGYRFTAGVAKDNIFGTQFHPEKSGETGLKMLKAFGGLK